MSHKKILIGLIVLLVVIIGIVLIYNFSIKEKEGVAEPDPISFQCASACESGQKVAFCDVDRSFSGGMATCNELATNSQYSQYNVQTCPAISCTTQGTGTSGADTCAGLGAIWVDSAAQNTCPAQEGKLVRKRTPSDNPPIAGQICCYYYE